MASGGGFLVEEAEAATPLLHVPRSTRTAPQTTATPASRSPPPDDFDVEADAAMEEAEGLRPVGVSGGGALALTATPRSAPCCGTPPTMVDQGGCSGAVDHEAELAMLELERRGAARPPPSSSNNGALRREGMCIECNARDGQPRFLEAFGLAVCYDCQKANKGQGGKYQLITKSKAKDEYLLTDRQLSSVYGGLGCQKVPNPHRANGGEMSLYLRIQAEELALQTWKSSEGLYEEMRRRADERKARREKASRKRDGADAPMKYGDKKKKSGPPAAASSVGLPFAPSRHHEHVFLSDEEYDGDSDLWTKRCECGFSVQYERL